MGRSADRRRLAADSERTQSSPPRRASRSHLLRISRPSCRYRGSLRARARRRDLAGLGFSHAEQQRPCAEFSGGWACGRARRTLFAQPDLLCWTSRPTISTSRPRCGSRSTSRANPHSVMVISHDRTSRQRRPTGSCTSRPASSRSTARLQPVRAGAPRAPGARSQARQEAGGRAQAPHRLRRPLPRQSDQGAPGAVPHEAAAKNGAGRGGGPEEVRRSRFPRRRSRVAAIIALDGVTVATEPGPPGVAAPHLAHRRRRPDRAAAAPTANGK